MTRPAPLSVLVVVVLSVLTSGCLDITPFPTLDAGVTGGADADAQPDAAPAPDGRRDGGVS